MPRLLFSSLLALLVVSGGCRAPKKPHLVVTSKFFTEQVILAELLAQHIEARTGIPVVRKPNLGGTLLVHKAMLSGDVDLYVEYTGTALTAVLGEKPEGDANAIYERVRDAYRQRFALEVTEPLGFENTFAMVVRGDVARATQDLAFFFKGNHRHRHFGRKLGGVTPEIAVQHQVAQDADSPALESWQEAL